MANPARGADWFELYSSADLPVDLNTVTLSDDPSIAGGGKFRPVPLSFIGPRGFVKWVADSDPGQGRNLARAASRHDGGDDASRCRGAVARVLRLPPAHLPCW